jgi:hypothetical protein
MKEALTKPELIDLVDLINCHIDVIRTELRRAEKVPNQPIIDLCLTQIYAWGTLCNKIIRLIEDIIRKDNERSTNEVRPNRDKGFNQCPPRCHNN